MERRNRNILFIVLGVVLVLCCCAALTLGGAVALLWPRTSVSRPQPGPVVEVMTASPATAAPTGTPLPPPNTAPAAATPVAGAITGTATATGAGDSTEARLAQADMLPRDMRALTMRLKPGAGDVPVTVNPTPPSYKVGDQLKFWVGNNDTQEHQQVTATLRYVTAHVYMWVENGISLNDADLKASADRFENKTYPTDREFFGSEWTPGIDNDVHLSILHAGGLGESVAGYFSSADEYSHLANPYSNEREMFYIAADNGKARPNTPGYDEVLAHEFQHMIHWNNDREEAAWVNEGMSELAGHLNGYETSGFEYAYADEPDTQLNTWADSSQRNVAHYGASYLFMDYFLDRFGENLTKAVVASKKQGIAGFDDALAKAGRSERFNDIYADWLVANYLDQPDAAPKGRFGYSDIDPPEPKVAESYRRFPASDSMDVAQYGADYIELRASGKLTVDFRGQATVKVVNTDPRGRYAWYSNRGDDSDATLTRAFDLSKVSSATLTFSTWYNIEDGWDYAYVEVSTDNGQHWQIVRGRQSTDKNPVGNAFGPGWTGASGGGTTPQWVAERVDLSPFVGKQILLRFEYVTDDEVNLPGFLLDNISIPELNYKDGGENGTGGWQAAGWALIDNTLPQPWLVQLIAANRDGVQVQRLSVSADGTGEITLPDAGKYDHLMLVVSGLAPVTTEQASYSYSIATQ